MPSSLLPLPFSLLHFPREFFPFLNITFGVDEGCFGIGVSEGELCFFDTEEGSDFGTAGMSQLVGCPFGDTVFFADTLDGVSIGFGDIPPCFFLRL